MQLSQKVELIPCSGTCNIDDDGQAGVGRLPVVARHIHVEPVACFVAIRYAPHHTL